MKKPECEFCGNNRDESVLYKCEHCDKVMCDECLLDHLESQGVIVEIPA